MTEDKDRHETRITVLEKLSETCDQQREDMNHRMDTMDARFDEHMTRTTQTSVEVVAAVTRLTVTMENLGETLRSLMPAAALAMKHETALNVLFKLGGIGALLASAGWALFTFFAK